MEYLNEILFGFSSYQLYLAIFALLLVTSLGMFPGNTDLFLLSLGAFASGGNISLSILIPTAFVALFVGESIAFIIGGRIGKKLFHIKFFQKEKYQLRINKMSALVFKGKIKTIFALRFIPLLRPLNIAVIASLIPMKREFYAAHISLLALYVPLNIYLAFEFSYFIKKMIS